MCVLKLENEKWVEGRKMYVLLQYDWDKRDTMVYTENLEAVGIEEGSVKGKIPHL
jgi:hypothetical protein